MRLILIRGNEVAPQAKMEKIIDEYDGATNSW
jgi:hypothetical protein